MKEKTNTPQKPKGGGGELKKNGLMPRGQLPKNNG